MTLEFTSLAHYSHCHCRDCMNIVVDGDGRDRELCDDCLFSQCDPERECQADGAYGGDEWINVGGNGQ